ncbi:MAG: radical SAM protein, partial [Candidatus Riflebacteria bacterium]|nr:radical SAM protein [Candidatus Riflebacteria bacterium]
MDERWPFFTVDIELTNICGQNCRFCPRLRITRPAGFIDPGLFAQIMRQLAQQGSRVTLCGMGNPLLHPHWHEIAAICRESGLKYGLTIQAPALDQQNIAKIEELAPFFIEISFPTIDQEHFSRIYPDQDLTSSLNGLQNLITARGSTRGISIISIRTADEPLAPEKTADFWSERKLSFRQHLCHSRGGNLEEGALTTARTIEKCGLFATHSFITWQGRLLACCHD